MKSELAIILSRMKSKSFLLLNLRQSPNIRN